MKKPKEPLRESDRRKIIEKLRNKLSKNPSLINESGPTNLDLPTISSKEPKIIPK